MFVQAAQAYAAEFGAAAANREVIGIGRAVSPGANWKVRGDKSVQPARISDDGQRTYLEWKPEQSLPAVFAINATGAEEVVDGYMRGGVFVIDRVHSSLVFRIDRDKAVATRGAGAS